MPVQGPQWTEFLSCHVCFKVFDDKIHLPISLGCSHSVCKLCLLKLQQSRCPFDQSPITVDVNDLPVNNALLQLVGGSCHKKFDASVLGDNAKYYQSATKCIEDLALLLKPLLYDAISLKSEIDDESSKKTGGSQFSCILSRPMQRKLVTLINCQLLEEEGRARIMRVARSLGERTVTELILQHQNPQQLSANLWAAVRARGCQFLGPAMQEEVLSLILLALEDGSALSRKVLVLFVVQRLEPQYPHASKTAIGHVVQLLYRASCFKVTKREEESSLMQLKEEFRTHETLRREHDSQIVEIALEAGLRISPEQWSSLLYGDAHHKSHMQSIIDKLQTPQSFSQSVNELMIALERTGDPCNLQRLRPHLEFLSSVDPSPEMPAPSWENLEAVMKAVTTVVADLFDFLNSFSNRKHELHPLQNARYKTSMCRDLAQKGVCPRAASCTFAHSQEEIDKYRLRNKKIGSRNSATTTSAALSPKEKVELAKVNKTMDKKLNHNGLPNKSSDTEKPEEDTNTTEKNVPLESQKKTNDDLATSVEALTLQASTSTVSIVLSKAQKAESFVPPVQSHNRSVMSTTSKEPFVASNPPQPSCDVVQPPGGYQVYCPPLPPRPPPGPTYPYVAPDNTVYYSNPGYVNYDSQAVPPPSGQWSHPWYNHNQAVPYVPGVQSWDIGMYGPGWNQPGNVQQNSNQTMYGSYVVYSMWPPSHYCNVSPLGPSLVPIDQCSQIYEASDNNACQDCIHETCINQDHYNNS